MTLKTVPLCGPPSLARGPTTQNESGPREVCRGGQASVFFQAGCAVMAEVTVSPLIVSMSIFTF